MASSWIGVVWEYLQFCGRPVRAGSARKVWRGKGAGALAGVWFGGQTACRERGFCQLPLL